MVPMINCDIYKGTKKQEMYLYVPKESGLKKVPDTLLAGFGQPELVMSLLLTKSQKLARVDATSVISALQNQGYFLQMPPSKFSSAATQYPQD
jgi:uncharacterized protein YcgL (UPF0745 family)